MLIGLRRSTVWYLERFIWATLVRIVASSDLVRRSETPLVFLDVVAGSVSPKDFPAAFHEQLLKLEAI